jgi:hypothetical protein
MIETWAVVCSKGRPDVLHKCLASIAPQVTAIVFVDNNDQPEPVSVLTYDRMIYNSWMPGFPPNLSKLINNGLHLVDGHARRPEWNVVLLNDDVTVPPGWVESLAGPLRAGPAALAYTDRIGRGEQVLMTAPPGNPQESMTGWACMLRGELGIRWDETLQWWYGDNDLDLRCRLEHGGVLAVPGEIPFHSHPSSQTFASVELSQQAHRDGVTFAEKWTGKI